LQGTASKLAGGQKVISMMEKLYFSYVFSQEEKTSDELEKTHQLPLLGGTIV